MADEKTKNTFIPGQANSPVRSQSFRVKFASYNPKGFLACDLPRIENNVAKYREGTNTTPQPVSLHGNTTYGNLVLKRGLKHGDTELTDWVADVRKGKMTSSGRDDIDVEIFDSLGASQGNVVAHYKFLDAWPARYEPPTLEAMGGGGQAEVLIETFEFEFEEVNRKK